jgi:predicted aldo/keto reductase-like oxidoreductase
MIYRKYGNTGKDISLIGMGTSRLDNDKTKFVTNVDLVLKAIELGINYFDTAPTYASGTSERVLGEALLNNRKNVYISTKSMLSMESTADDVLNRIDASLRLLHIDKITFYHMWSVMDLRQYKEIIKPGGPLEGVYRAKKMGMVEHVCFSAHCDGNDIITILEDGFFDGITLGFNVLNFRYRIEALKQASRQNIGIAIMNPLGGGLIPNNEKYFGFLQKFGYTVTESALLFVASHKEVTTVLIGVNKEEDLLNSVKTVTTENLLTPENIKILYDSASTFLDNSLCTMCGYCNGCPMDIPIRNLMSLFNEYILSNGNKDHYHYMMQMQFNFSPFEIYRCINCAECERKCTQHLPIIKRIEKINLFGRREIRKWKKIIDNVIPKTKEKLGLYGITFDAENLIKSYILLYQNIDFPLMLFDSNSAKWGKRFMDTDYIIESPDKIPGSGIKRIIITTKKYYKEIRYDLRKYINDDVDIVSI